MWYLQKGRPRYCWQNQICYRKEKFKLESLVYHNKNLKHNFFFNMVSAKPIPQLSIFCLLQGIINYVQINTYWNCIVPIGIFINLTSNIILLASKYTILVHCRSIWVICVWGLETWEKARLRRAFSLVSRRIHIFTYMLRQCTCIVFILQF